MTSKNTFPSPKAPRPHLVSRRPLLAAGLLAPLLSACGASSSDKKDAAPNAGTSAGAGPRGRATSVQVQPAAAQTITPVVKTDARAQGISSPLVAAEVAGVVRRVAVRPGQSVRKGELLLELDATDAQLQAQEAQALQRQAQAQLREREKEKDRAQSLFDQEFISRAQWDAALLSYDMAKEQARAAQSRAELAGRGLSKARVLAPADGVVTELEKVAGDFVRVGDPLLRVNNTTDAVLIMRVDQVYLDQMRVGLPVWVRWQGQELQTVLASMSPAIEANSRSFLAYAKAPQDLLKAPGAFVDARIELPERKALLLPSTAVQRNAAGQAHVFVFKDGKAVKQEVQPGELYPQGVEILYGLQEGEGVIVQGAAFLNDGQAVTKAEPSATTPAAEVSR